MRLAVVSPFLDRQHGTELCILEQIERLARDEQWEVHLYAQSVRQLEGIRPTEYPAKPAEWGIFWHKITEIPGPHLLKYSWWFVANQFRRWRDKRFGRVCADLTYSPGINCFDAGVIVVHIVFHEFYARVKPELGLRRLPLRTWPVVLHRKLYYRLIMSLENRIYRNPKVRLIAVSAHVANQLEARFGRTGVTVIPDSVDTARFRPTALDARRMESRKRFGFNGGDFVILFIGNDWKNKGLDALLRACVLLSDLPWQLMVVGRDVEEAYREKLRHPELQNRVRFERPSADVLTFYAAADLYISPSLEDAFGLPILEAMACGLPVIASIQAGASENIRDGETGLHLKEPRDAGEIAERIRLLLGNATMRERMGTAAARYVQENCSWEKNVAKTKEFLEAALRERVK